MLPRMGRESVFVESVTEVLLQLAVILLSTKLLGILARKIGLPQVVGAVVAGLLVGPAIWGMFGWWSPISFKSGSHNDFFFKSLAEIGVVMLLFSAGLETNVKELKKSGLASTVIALGGVLVPLAAGFLIAVPFLGGFKGLTGENALNAIFIGVILTATSVGITVECLKEMGRLKGRLGTIILSAAIIDDVIGIVVLSVVLGFKTPNVNVGITVAKMLGFFVAAIAVGIGINYLFRFIMKKYPHTRRIPILAIIVCLIYAYVAERVFGIADITGAYMAGIMLSNLRDTGYIDRRVDIMSYMFFSPIFFAYIGIHADFTGINGTAVLFAAVFVLVAILGKIIGSGLAARAFKFSRRESLIIGSGMIARGEVALVVCAKGVEAGMFAGTSVNPTIAVIFLVIVSSLCAPMLLKGLFKKYNGEPPVFSCPQPLMQVSGGASVPDGHPNAPHGEMNTQDSAPPTDTPPNNE